MSNETILAFLEMQLQEAEQFSEEVLTEAGQIKERIEALREKIGAHIKSPQNMRGLLSGQTDDYLKSFDAAMDQLKTQLDVNVDKLRKKVDGNDQSVQNHMKKIQDCCTVIQSEMHDIVYEQKTWQPVLKDLPCFGDELKDDERNFRWPTKEDIEKLGWTEPPTLKAIRTKGYPKNCLTAMQLVFGDGTESPFFDVKREQAEQEGVKTV